jgi:hypothetical protein
VSIMNQVKILIRLLISLMYKSDIPSKDSLDIMTREQRLNMFRKFLAISRHHRLIVHHELVRSTFDLPLRSHIDTLNQIYINTYFKFVDNVKEYGFHDELLDAIKEEDSALEKIISAYERKMSSNTSVGTS